MSGNNDDDQNAAAGTVMTTTGTGTGGLTPRAFREVVDNLTIAALREYDDGPLTPPRPEQTSAQELNLNETENDMAGDNDNNLVVLDPDHPLMVRFQNALKNLLERREQRLTADVRETKYQLDKVKRQREELGVELYGLQQELAKNQKSLEEKFDDYNDTAETRKLVEDDLAETRKTYREQQKRLDDEMRKLRDLQAERDNLKLRIFHMNLHKDVVRGDIAVLRRATEKAETEKMKFEVEKQRQDMLVNRLQEQEGKLKEDITLYQWQLKNQMEETKVARHALEEARMESEAIEKEKNQLMLNWTNCLNGMKRRDEAYSQMNDAIRAQRQKFDSTVTEIDSYKKSIIKEQEKNESLTLITNQRVSEIKNLDKSLQITKDRMDTLQQEYSQFNRALKETEAKLTSIKLDIGQKKSELSQNQREIEKLSEEKVRIEDEMFKELQKKLTAEKAAEYSDKLRNKQKEKLAEVEKKLAEIENEVARSRLESLQKRSMNEALERECASLQKEIDDRNRIVSKSESEIRKRVLLIEAKQGQIDLYNKKIDHLIEKAGGVELGPLELEEKNLNKEIDDLIARIMELEQKWLREQNELVMIVKEREVRATDINELNNRLIVFTTKNMRTEKSIEEMEANIRNLERGRDHIRLEIEKLNKYIDVETRKKQNLENELRTTSSSFERSLKASENVAVELQSKIKKNQEDKEMLAKMLIDTDQLIMDWERKIRLAKEMKSAVDSEVGQGEIKEMKFEIHRMEARLTYLLKEQEKVIRELEASVLRRDTIFNRGEIAQKNPAVQTQGKVQKEMSHIQRKIKETNQDINKIDTEIRLLRDKQQQLANVLDDKQKNLQILQKEDEDKTEAVENLIQKKQERIEERIAKQNFLKYYDRVKSGKYKMYCGGKVDTLEQELGKQMDKLRSLSAIVSKLGDEFPDVHATIRRVETSIQSRLNQEEEQVTERV